MNDFELLLITEMEIHFGDDIKRIKHAKMALSFAKQLMHIESGDANIIIPWI